MENTREKRRELLEKIQGLCGRLTELKNEWDELCRDAEKIKAAKGDGLFASKDEILNGIRDDLNDVDAALDVSRDLIRRGTGDLREMCLEAGDIDTLFDCAELVLAADIPQYSKMFLLQDVGVALSRKKEQAKKAGGEWMDAGQRFGALGRRVHALESTCIQYERSPAGFWWFIALFVLVGAVLLLPWVCPPVKEFLLSHTVAAYVICGLPAGLLGLIGAGLGGALAGAFLFIIPAALISRIIPVEDEAAKNVYAALIVGALTVVGLLYFLVKEPFSKCLFVWTHRKRRKDLQAELPPERAALMERCGWLIDQLDRRIDAIKDLSTFEVLFFLHTVNADNATEAEKRASRDRLADKLMNIRFYYASLLDAVKESVIPQ